MAANLLQVEQAYRDDLDYHVVERGAISADLATGWGASLLTGRRYVILQPSSNEPVYLRFIEDVSATMLEPMKTEGWNAVEILVKDPDALAQALDRSEHFRVVGARDHSALSDFYQTTLGMPVTAPVPYRIGILSKAYNLPVETRHELSIAQLSERFLIEMDRYPGAASARYTVPGSLPSGIAMVTFEVEEWQQGLPYVAGSARQSAFPYLGRRAGVLIGTAGEYIELVERLTIGLSDVDTN